MTRRALLGAGALVLVGCGPPDEPEVVPADVLEEQWRASAAAAASYEGVDGVAELRGAAEARTRRLAGAVERAGGTVPARPAASSSGLDDVLAAESHALEVHVAGVGQLEAREYRTLLAGVIAGTAAAESALRERLHRPPAPSPFPGQPSG